MLYLAFITIFSAFVVSDMRRIHARKGDCCGLCCCRYDSVVCCRGHFLTSRQRAFLNPDKGDQGADPPKEDASGEYASSAERVIATVFAPSILTREGRGTILVSWCLLAVWAVYGITQMKSTFSMEFFIPKGSYTDMFH